jgi:hypothetical protein
MTRIRRKRPFRVVHGERKFDPAMRSSSALSLIDTFLDFLPGARGLRWPQDYLAGAAASGRGSTSLPSIRVTGGLRIT